MNKQAGFTLIELITVIVILGILSAFALPRFAGLEAHARAASLDGLSGSIRSGAALAHSLWLATGSSAATVTMEGQSIDIDTTTGYPKATAAGIKQVISDLNGFDAAVSGSDMVFNITGMATITNCKITYTLGSGAGVPPSVTVAKSNCQ